MRDDDVRLTDGERAAFAELARRLTEDRLAGNGGDMPSRSFDGRARRDLWPWLLVVLGVGGMATGLVMAEPWAGVAAFVILSVAVHRLTRRWNCARLLLWWRRRPPESPPHMWEP